MSEVKFWRCNHCGNVFATVTDGGVTPMCCGEKMELLNPNTVDAAQEKHVPVVTTEAGGHVLKVSVGAVEHPSTPEHYIEWICAVSGGRIDLVHLNPGDKPQALFPAEVMTSGTVYAYCNLHGLWKAEF